MKMKVLILNASRREREGTEGNTTTTESVEFVL
jgi:hypothetical protein